MNRIAVIAFAMLVVASSAHGQATPTVSFPSITNALENTSGQTFDVTVSNPSKTTPGSGEQVGSYSIYFQVTRSAGGTGSISFIGDWATMAPNPLFPGNNPFESPATGSSSDPVVTTFLVTDFPAANVGTLDNGKGVFRGVYATSADARGTFDLKFIRSGPTASSFQDGSNQDIAVNFVDGSITVPEPATAGLLVGLGGLLLLRTRHAVA